MQKKLISVIVPIYNCAPYLDRCFHSLCMQNYENTEILLIDDGSKDDGAAICKKYVQQYPQRFKYYYKENGGLSSARNHGLSFASGEYIMFVDSDDWVHENMLSRMAEEMTAHDLDFVICDPLVIRGSEKYPDCLTTIPPDTILEKKDISPDVLREIAGAVWRIMYKRSIIGDDIRFSHGLKLTEDKVFNVPYIGASRRFKYIQECLYYYALREGSLATSYYYDLPEIALRTYREISSSITTCWTPAHQRAYDRLFLSMSLDGILNICTSRNESWKQQYSRLLAFCRVEEMAVALKSVEERCIKHTLIERRLIFPLFLITKLSNTSLWNKLKRLKQETI